MTWSGWKTIRYDNWWLNIYGIVLSDLAPALVFGRENQDWLWLAPDQLELAVQAVPGDWERWQAIASKLLELERDLTNENKNLGQPLGQATPRMGF